MCPASCVHQTTRSQLMLLAVTEVLSSHINCEELELPPTGLDTPLGHSQGPPAASAVRQQVQVSMPVLARACPSVPEMRALLIVWDG